MKRPGAYQLLIHLPRETRIAVGKLGESVFPRGYYVYTGSALGGLDGRLARHLSRTKRRHWHIDYLLEHAAIVRYAIVQSPASMECSLNALTAAMAGAKVLIERFGSSDCRCRSHLIYFEVKPGELPADNR